MLLSKVFFICYSYPKYDREEAEIFEEYADDFKLINSDISESFDMETENSISVSRDRQKAYVLIKAGKCLKKYLN